MKKDLFEISNKIVILTGGLGLLGLNFVEALTSRGALVNIIDIQSKGKAISILRKKFGKNLSKINYHQGDVSKKEDLKKINKEILKKYKKIDVLINNAAINPKVENNKYTGNKFEKIDLETWNKGIEINLTGTMLSCQVFGENMKKGSSIINVSSTYGVVAPDQSIYPKNFIKPATYGATKSAVINLTKYLSSYWGKKGIRINTVVFGGVENKQDMSFIKKYSKKTHLGRMAKENEYNGAIIYLSSDASSYMTGANMVIDGGWTAW